MKITNDAPTLLHTAENRYNRTLKLHRERWRSRLLMWLLIAFAGLALLICACSAAPHLF